MSAASAPADPIAVYASTRDALVADIRRLDPEAATTRVPGCPEWTVADVLAHLCGLNDELLDGIEPPLGTDERTTAQVARHAGWEPAAICDEWQSHDRAIRRIFASNLLLATGLLADLAVHVHDIAEAVAEVGTPDPAAEIIGCERYIPLLQQRLADNCDVALTVELEGVTPTGPTAGGRPLTLSAAPTDFLLTVTGRRTRAQAEALEWSEPPGRVLDHMTQYGPYRDA